MRKWEELADAKSCFNRADVNEVLFVLLARDPAAPATIRFWAKERARLGKNLIDDRQIEEALACAAEMEKAFREHSVGKPWYETIGRNQKVGG